ncbi:hypothetical protein [Aerosakkonema funiforme]|uniref:hypothetical protein n=1 Tax=Aerosakkonema funiforme TaxID=1246630 RepID=UPI0035B86505
MTSKTLLQPTHQHLRTLRNKLLHLHQVLLETERIVYEQVRGRVSGGELLQLIIHHEQFTWLHPLSELVVQIDEILASDEPILLEDVQNAIASARTLLSPIETGNAFQSRYSNALQRSPDVVLAHAEVSQFLMSKIR